LDHTRACIDALPEVVEAVDGRAEVVVDGGFMRGADVVKGLCLGADAVGMGRLEGLAMAAGGSAAVVRALEIVEHEIKTSMALMGISELKDLNPSLMERTQPLTPPHVLAAFPLLDEGY
jgi:glycolate oxidase